LTAKYSGDDNYGPASGTATLNVISGKVTPTVTLSCTPNPVVSGASTTCAASVAPGSTGSVVFTYNGGNPWTTVNVDGSGNATVTNGFLNAPLGSYTVTASYSGDSHFNAANASTTFTVNSGKTTPTVTLTCSPGTIISGQTSTCTAHVSGGATGTVALYEWSTYLWSLPLDDSGNAIGNANFDNLAEESPAQSIPLTVNYSGDSNFNTASATSTLTVTAGTSQNYSYAYDRYGNRWQENPNGAQLLFNSGNNQISGSGYGYDAAGNLTSDGIHTYGYDAEGNMVQVDGGATAKYTYNALNQRVRIDQGSTAREFVFNLTGQRTSVWDGNSGSQIQGQTYWGGLPVEFYSGGTAHFQHQDWLGTERVRTTYTGAVEGAFTSLPFGDRYTFSGADNDPYHFATLDKDYYGSSDSQTDHAQFRQYSDAQGRWMSPDPYDGSYDLSNPQSLNRYSYVLNNPLSFTDPSGLSTTQPVVCGYYPDGTPIYCMTSQNDGDNGNEPIGALGSAVTGSGPVPTYSGAQTGRYTNTPPIVKSIKPGGTPSKMTDCGQILSGAALTVGLDAAGVVAGAIPGSGAALVGAQVAIGLAGGANSAIQGDSGGTLAATIGGAQLSAVAAGAEQVGWTTLRGFGGTIARSLPGIGTAVSAFYFYKDASEAIDKYQSCRAGTGG
jgi:RHS repeat-associated protein